MVGPRFEQLRPEYEAGVFLGPYGFSMKMAVFWDVALCSFTEIERRITGAYYRHQMDVPLP
jgi:hypothetical protein